MNMVRLRFFLNTEGMEKKREKKREITSLFFSLFFSMFSMFYFLAVITISPE